MYGHAAVSDYSRYIFYIFAQLKATVQYETLLFRLLRGEMEEAEFCQELDRIQRAWLMENQITFEE